jgi:hypothetical protein
VLLAHRIMGAPQEEPHHQYFTEDVTGDTFQCDTAVYTVTSGTVRTVVHEGPALRQRELHRHHHAAKRGRRGGQYSISVRYLRRPTIRGGTQSCPLCLVAGALDGVDPADLLQLLSGCRCRPAEGLPTRLGSPWTGPTLSWRSPSCVGQPPGAYFASLRSRGT